MIDRVIVTGGGASGGSIWTKLKRFHLGLNTPAGGFHRSVGTALSWLVHDVKGSGVEAEGEMRSYVRNGLA